MDHVQDVSQKEGKKPLESKVVQILAKSALAKETASCHSNYYQTPHFLAENNRHCKNKVSRRQRHEWYFF